MTIRALEEQFEPQKVSEIRRLIKQYETLRMRLKDGSAGYLISGITRSLETGIILGALSISFSLLEMFIHDLVIFHEKRKDTNGNDSRPSVPPLKTGRRQLPFERYVQEFVEEAFIDAVDGEALLSTYRRIGIPLHHILSRHIGPFSRMMIAGEQGLLDRFLTSRFGDFHKTEEMIEDHATDAMRVIVGFMIKYQNHGATVTG